MILLLQCLWIVHPSEAFFNDSYYGRDTIVTFNENTNNEDQYMYITSDFGGRDSLLTTQTRQFGARDEEKTKTIHLAGIFPIDGVEGWQGGQACEPAAKMALDDVNSSPDILQGYKLKLHSNDSGCDAGQGGAVLYELLYNKPQKVILLAGCSTVCTTVAEAAQMFNLVTVCYGASSPALSNRKRFPTLFRTHPSATVHNPTRIRIFEKYKWTKVSILQEAEEVFSTTLDDLESRAKVAGIHIATRQSFLRDPTAAVANLKRQDARIIVGLFYAKAARKVLCEIYKQKLYGQKYVWFFIGWYEDDWFKNPNHLLHEGINCTVDEMKAAAENHFTTEALQWNQDTDSPTFSGKTVEDFDRKLKDLLRANAKYAKGIDKGVMPEGYLEAPLAYDAIWALAIALNNTILKLKSKGASIDDYTYENQQLGSMILEEFGDIKFEGISGSVAFNEQTGDRIAWTQIEQLQNGKYEVIGFYDQKTDNLTWIMDEKEDKEKIFWLGGKIPQDRTFIRYELMTVSIGLYLTMAIMSGIGCTIAFLLICFNFKYGHRRIIQHSHPSCNNLMLIGIIMSLLAIIPGGLDGRFVSPSTFPITCNLGTWLLNIGFSLSYGAMFSKIWRVHRIVKMSKEEGNSNNATAQAQVVVPWKLWLAVGFLIMIDIILLSAWTISDPLKREVKNFSKIASSNPNEDIEIVPQLEHCKSYHHQIWLGIIYAYKGLQLILGLFLTYETRSQKVKQINDSRLVGMAIYNVVLLCSITAPVMLVIGDQQDAAFCFVSLANLFCCFLSMALIFGPKIVFIKKHSHDPRDHKEEDEKNTLENERKYREIVKQNDELQRILKQREGYLANIRKRCAALRTEHPEIFLTNTQPKQQLQQNHIEPTERNNNTIIGHETNEKHLTSDVDKSTTMLKKHQKQPHEKNGNTINHTKMNVSFSIVKPNGVTTDEISMTATPSNSEDFGTGSVSTPPTSSPLANNNNSEMGSTETPASNSDNQGSFRPLMKKSNDMLPNTTLDGCRGHSDAQILEQPYNITKNSQEPNFKNEQISKNDDFFESYL